MAMIEGFRIQNYRVLKDVTFGKLWNTWHIDPLTPLRNLARINWTSTIEIPHSNRDDRSINEQVIVARVLTAVIGKNGVGKSTVFAASGCGGNDGTSSAMTHA